MLHHDPGGEVAVDPCSGPAAARPPDCELTYAEMNTWVKMLKQSKLDPLVYDYDGFEEALRTMMDYRDQGWLPMLLENLTYSRIHYPRHTKQLLDAQFVLNSAGYKYAVPFLSI